MQFFRFMILGPVKRMVRTPTVKMLREEGGPVIAMADRCTVYDCGYGVYDNGSARTVMFLPKCTKFTYYFVKQKESEKGGPIKEKVSLPDGFLGSQSWILVMNLIGEHRIEGNLMNRTGSRLGTKDFDFNDKGDKDGSAEAALERAYRSEYFWRDGRFGENPEQALIRKEDMRAVLECMSDKVKNAFLLYYYYGYNQKEIAEQTGQTQQNVSYLLSKAVAVAKKIFRN